MLAMALAGTIALGGVEVILRVFSDDDRYFPHHPNTVEHFYPSNEITPGVTGISRVTINSHGTRGPELEGQKTRILAVGGSTTICNIVDDCEAWPSLLMEYLNDAPENEGGVWVTNSGICGTHSEHHLMHATYLLPRLPRIDYMVVYAGINDLGYWLHNKKFDRRYLDDSRNWSGRIGESFRQCSFTSRTDPWFKHCQLWKLGSRAKARYQTWHATAGSLDENGIIVQDERLLWLKQRQLKRQQRLKVKIPAAKLETLSAALDSYASNLNAIIDCARQCGVEPILMAQAMPEHALSSDERERLWMGSMDGGNTYVLHSERLEMLAKYNDRMRKVAEKRHVLFLDLPTHLKSVRHAYYDDCHFNELGCRETARFVAEQLQPVLKTPRETSPQVSVNRVHGTL